MSALFEVSALAVSNQPIQTVTWSADREHLFVASRDKDFSVSQIQIQTGHEHILFTGAETVYVSASPTLPLLAIRTNSAFRLYDYREKQIITQFPLEFFSLNSNEPRWSHNGLRVAFSARETDRNTFTNHQNRLYVLHPYAKTQVSKADPREIINLSWSSSSDDLCIELANVGELAGLTMTITAEHLQFITYILKRRGFTFGPKTDQAFWWQVDGKQWELRVTPSFSLESDVGIMQFAPHNAHLPQVLWSPCGNKLLIIVNSDSAEAVYLYNLRSGVMFNVSDHSPLLSGAKRFVWEPEGTAFACISKDTNQVVICRL